MIRLGKFCFVLCLLLLSFLDNARAGPLPALERVLQNGFPAREDDLANVTQALFQEYQHGKNVVSLIFYSYGLLLQARHYTATHDYINAAEYSRTAFFYLDEAIERNEGEPRVRYLRARVDAWLPARFGRCVITLDDTAHLLTVMQNLTAPVLKRIAMMRYRALFSCHKFAQAEQLLKQNNSLHKGMTSFTAKDASTSPQWDAHEINEIVLPLLKGE